MELGLKDRQDLKDLKDHKDLKAMMVKVHIKLQLIMDMLVQKLHGLHH